MERERTLVELLGSKPSRLEAMRELAGGVTATELRRACLSKDALTAVVDGLEHRNPQVRFWCLQILDHVPTADVERQIVGMLDDPIPRVRRLAAHALACGACKPGWSGASVGVVDRLRGVASNDPNGKVRAEAMFALASLEMT